MKREVICGLYTPRAVYRLQISSPLSSLSLSFPNNRLLSFDGRISLVLFVFALGYGKLCLDTFDPPHKPTPEFLDGPQSPNSWAFDVRLGRACLYVETVQIQSNFVDGFGVLRA